MAVKVVTFDFHNTLAICDEWFELEVRTIAPRFLEWYAIRRGFPLTADLRDRAAPLYRALRQEIMVHGREHDIQSCVLHVLGLLGVPATPDDVRDGIQELMLESLANSHPGEGVVETVQALHSSGVRLVVVSSAAHHAFLEWSLAKFGILHLFEFIGSSARLGYYKSTGKIYERVMQLMAEYPAHAIHVGDSHKYDVEPANGIGMRTIWLDTGNGGAHDDHSATIRVTTLRGLAHVVLALPGGEP